MITYIITALAVAVVLAYTWYTIDLRDMVEDMEYFLSDYTENSIPTKPIIKNTWSQENVPHCPTCKSTVHGFNTDEPYCKKCGQALDWSVTNEDKD